MNDSVGSDLKLIRVIRDIRLIRVIRVNNLNTGSKATSSSIIVTSKEPI